MSGGRAESAAAAAGRSGVSGSQSGRFRSSARRRLFQHSVCEVCSSFYTSNPLMYISRYSEIIVTSGYDLDTGITTTTTTTSPAAGSMFGWDQLSNRRELVEQLDSAPLFDYLLQNGALKESMVEELRNEKSAAKVNLALLKHVETSGKPALNLFINALRQTGQHHLASLLDDSQRIKALSGSGYLSKNRHKGQVSLQVNVRALRFPLHELAAFRKPDANAPLIPKNASLRGALGTREWVSLEEIRYRILELTEPKVLPPSSLAPPHTEVGGGGEDDNSSKSCLCLCFRQLFSRRKGNPEVANQSRGKKNHKSNGVHASVGVAGKYKPAVGVYQVAEGGGGEGFTTSPTKTEAEKEELLNLRNLEDTFESKARELLRAVSEQSVLTAQLAKYFEQLRGVLVLETNFARGLVVVSICMKLEQLEALRRDYSNGKLNRDLEDCLLVESVLEQAGVGGARFHTDINQEEFELAEQELT